MQCEAGIDVEVSAVFLSLSPSPPPVVGCDLHVEASAAKALQYGGGNKQVLCGLQISLNCITLLQSSDVTASCSNG